MHYSVLIALVISTATTFLLGILITETFFNTGISYFAELPYAIKSHKAEAAIGVVECCAPGNLACCSRFLRQCNYGCLLYIDDNDAMTCQEQCKQTYRGCNSFANPDPVCYLNTELPVSPPPPYPVTSGWGGGTSGGLRGGIYSDIPDYSDFNDPFAPLTEPLP